MSKSSSRKTDPKKSGEGRVRSMTIRIDDELFWEAKRAAVDERISLNEFVCRAVRYRVNADPKE